MIKKNKIIIISALNSDYKMRTFPVISKLIPYCNKIIKLTSQCDICKEPANFTKRIVNENKLILVGGKKEYSARCLNCYELK